MNISDLIERLYMHREDYRLGYTCNLLQVYSDCEEAAVKLEQMQRFINDVLGDHYVDYLEFYANRCRKLEEELENIKNNN